MLHDFEELQAFFKFAGILRCILPIGAPIGARYSFGSGQLLLKAFPSFVIINRFRNLVFTKIHFFILYFFRKI